MLCRRYLQYVIQQSVDVNNAYSSSVQREIVLCVVLLCACAFFFIAFVFSLLFFFCILAMQVLEQTLKCLTLVVANYTKCSSHQT